MVIKTSDSIALAMVAHPSSVRPVVDARRVLDFPAMGHLATTQMALGIILLVQKQPISAFEGKEEGEAKRDCNRAVSTYQLVGIPISASLLRPAQAM